MRDEKTYQCIECGLHYLDENIMKQCEEFCKKHHACSIEITKNSLEAKKEEQS
jgi:hypothetical protein